MLFFYTINIIVSTKNLKIYQFSIIIQNSVKNIKKALT